ncbi:MAG: electron transfer flavoprotein subunit alpha/FixB family protein [Gammaproteobacteria bacterium]|nr:electron transfer flavoprotein subunit alpha/FixB family protein [Gammaproteobacteria bacterium]
MSKILVIAEHANGKLNVSTAKVVSCAQKIGGQIEVAVLAADGSAVAAEAAKLAGVARALQVDNAANANAIAAVLAPQIVELAKARAATHVLVAGSTFGKDLMPRVAALLGVPQVSDAMAVHGPNSFDRPTYAGNAITTVEVPGLVVATVRLASFAAVAHGTAGTVEKVAVAAKLPGHTRFVGIESHKSERPDLQSAGRVVSGGRAFGSAENFNILYALADKLGAGVGASRAAVDSGYVPNDMQVGQTGKIIAPELYMAIGISGAIQHLAGIKDARTIVAINKDPEAPIFEVADIGLVGDLFQVLPELTAKL